MKINRSLDFLRRVVMIYRIHIFSLIFNVVLSKEKLFDGNCGYVQSQAWPATAPWVASIRAVDLNSTLVFTKCSGALINHKYVVTPAVCVLNEEAPIVNVHLGMAHVQNFTINRPLSSGAIKTFYKVQEKIIHPLYSLNQTDNNIALLRLDRFVTYTEYVQPICLPFKQKIPVVGSKLSTSIWEKFEPFFASLGRSKQNALSTLITDLNIENKNLIESLEWANASAKVCNGRFGAPLSFTQNNQSYLLGILLKKAKCDSDQPHGYLNIFNYLNWIEKNVYSNYDRCSTPENETSTCISLDNCPILIHAFANPKKEYQDYLMKYLCSNDVVGGFQVCCPTSINSTELQADSTKLQTLSNKRFCGYQNRDDYFSNDSSIALDEFPWLAAIRAVDSNNKEFSVCSGSLINNRYVITSAFCALQYERIVSVRLGEYDILNKTDCVTLSQFNAEDCSESEDFGIDEIVVHPFYNPWTYNNDLALIRLNSSVAYSDYVRPICLPIPSLFKSPSYNDTFHSTSFTTPKVWGTDYMKKKLFFSLVKNSVCEYKHLLTDYQLCLVPKAAPTDRFMSCYDDDGAPAMIANRGQWTLQGISTERKSFCNVIHPIVQSKVAAYLPWIQENIQL